MTEPEFTVIKATAYMPYSPELAADFPDFTQALADALDPTKPSPPPWTGEPITPKPTAYLRLLEAADGIIRELVELHGPKPSFVHHDGTVGWWECGGCEYSGAEADPPNWPCDTTGVIAQHFAVDLSQP